MSGCAERFQATVARIVQDIAMFVPCKCVFAGTGTNKKDVHFRVFLAERVVYIAP